MKKNEQNEQSTEAMAEAKVGVADESTSKVTFLVPEEIEQVFGGRSTATLQFAYD